MMIDLVIYTCGKESLYISKVLIITFFFGHATQDIIYQLIGANFAYLYLVVICINVEKKIQYYY